MTHGVVISGSETSHATSVRVKSDAITRCSQPWVQALLSSAVNLEALAIDPKLIRNPPLPTRLPLKQLDLHFWKKEPGVKGPASITFVTLWPAAHALNPCLYGPQGGT